VTGLDNPTSENIAIWIWRCVETEVDGLSKVVVMEGHDFGCIYRGPDESR
jgi:6-pyruvoyltetrahydropterin/6-carboxytetrahydropterin synthase